MKKITLSIVLILSCGIFNILTAQMTIPKFGKGLQITSQDSSFYLKMGLRVQTLFQNEWNLKDDDFSALEDHKSAFSIRRARLKFSGWALSPTLKYKCQLALSNRDNGGGNKATYSNAANIILDAHLEWNFYKHLSVWVGQGTMPGNREKNVSSGNLQFVDRSRLNSRFTLDRDAGIMLKNHHKIGNDFIIKETVAITSGEGKNITSGNIGGAAYTFKVEALPFGKFQSKGAYSGSATKFEKKPKLAIAIAYDINQNAGRERGQKGSFIIAPDGIEIGKDLNTLYADLMFKYKKLSIMAEYVKRTTEDGKPTVFFGDLPAPIATYYTGSATNFSIGYMMKNHWEIATRWTSIHPDEGVASDEDQYTVGLSKFIVGHKLKVQTDLTYRAIDTKDDDLIFRMQMEFHF